MARIVDTTPAFEAYARAAALEGPMRREMLWRERYEAAHPDVFEAFYATHASPEGRPAVVRELSRVRERVKEAAPVMRAHVEEVDPALGQALGLPPEPTPVHVLMVGTFSTNAAVGRLGDDVAVFHCLEWFQSPEGARVLVAHEGTHAWHRIATGEEPPDDDLAWLAFSEGVAIQASREVVPGRPEVDYFWYGHPESEEWLPWCQARRDAIIKRFAVGLDDPKLVDAFFGAGFVDGQWRVGYYVADELVRSLGKPLPELARMGVEEGKAAIREALAAAAD